MSKIRRPTEFRKTTLAQELTEILPPETPPPTSPGAYRMVQILVPPESTCAFSLDHPTPGEAGPNRTYDLLQISSNAFARFRMLPDQRLFGASLSALAQAGVIVQYLEEG
jgi:hypothetical protein